MNCFFCATPYHVIASITMACGTFAGQEAMLVVLDHFDIDEQMVERIKKTGIFRDVLLYKSNNKTKWNKFKRLVNVFCPDNVMRHLAHDTKFEHCVFFALDFLNIAYMKHIYGKRKISCEFAFGDDGIGAYLNSSCYQPNELVQKLLKITGRMSDLESVKKLYVYKPELMIENTAFELLKIQQSGEIYKKLQCAVSEIFLMSQDVDVNNKILYFEQPSTAKETDQNVLAEQEMLRKAVAKLNTGAVVKMHPRSVAEEKWKEFTVLKTKIPFEAMVLQSNYSPVLMMSNCSTAMFSVYLLDNLPVANCPSIFLNRMIPYQNERFNAAMERYFQVLNSADQKPYLYSPTSEEEFMNLLDNILVPQ